MENNEYISEITSDTSYDSDDSSDSDSEWLPLESETIESVESESVADGELVEL